MESNSKRKARILTFFLCLSLIANSILIYSYVKNAHYYEQVTSDADYTIDLLRSESSDSYDKGYVAGYDDGWDEGAEAQRESDQKYINQQYGSSSYNDNYVTTTVYITNTGSKYHRYGCQYLRHSCHRISISDAEAQGYEPCSVCW